MIIKELVALLGIKTDKKGLKDAEGGLKGLMKLAKAAAIAFAGIKVFGFVKNAIKEITGLGDRFDKLSKKTGVATTTLQQFEHAASLSGASLGDIESGIRRLQAAQVDAQAGLKTYTREFQRLGVSVRDEQGNFKDTTQLLMEIADGMKELGSDAERTAVATKLLGRGGANLIPMLKEGSGALREMMQEMDDFGAVIREDAIKASADYVDNQQRISMATRGIKLAITEAALPAINQATDAMLDWWRANGKWVRQGIQSIFARLAPIVGRVASVFGRLISAFLTLIRWSGKLFSRLPDGAKKFIALGLALMGIIKLLKMGAWGKFGLILGGIFLVVEDFLAFLDGKESLFGDFNDWLIEAFDIDLRDSFEGMKMFFDDLTDETKDTSDVLGALWDEMALVIEGYMDRAWQSTSLGLDILSAAIEEFIRQGIEAFKFSLGSTATWITETFLGVSDDVNKILFSDIMGGLTNLGDGIVNWANGVYDSVVGLFEGIGDFFTGMFGRSGHGKTLPPQIRGINEVQSTGGQVTPNTIAPAEGAMSYYSENNANISVDVSAAPGMDESKLAAQVASQTKREVKKVLDNQNRTAGRSLRPSVAGSFL